MNNKETLQVEGKVFKFGNSVDTDQIIPARYLKNSSREKLATHCMSGVDEDFSKKVDSGDIIVGGKDFGCGSSREHAPLSIKSCGVGAVIAESFARIFYRNAINIGLPIVEVEDFKASTGDVVNIDFNKGEIENKTTEQSWNIPEYPRYIKDIIEAGGLMEKLAKSQ
ncbi:MAG: 3-isopropylmalate dehydratase small subunit [Elusimicrobiota bacterium]